MSFFSPDSKFMQAMSRVADLVILNILFLVTCLPIFTIGAASTAMYSVCFRIGTEKEAGIFRPYFRAFRENFKQSTFMLLPLVFFGGILWVNITYFSALSGAGHALTYLFVLLLALVVFVYCYAFPLMSQFTNSVKATLKNALLLSIGYLPRTLMMAVMATAPLAVLVFDPVLFLQMGFLWVFLYFSATAYLCCLLLRKVFAPYMPENEEEAQ